jgi:hypothetical protein
MYDCVIWPEKHDPKTSAVYALNDIDVKEPPQVVWRLLVDDANWSSCCSYSALLGAGSATSLCTGLSAWLSACRVAVPIPPR